MTRLFLRFYLGVLVILFVAWLVQVWVNRDSRFAEQNAQVVRDALYGGVRLAVEKIERTAPDEQPRAYAGIKESFDYPVSYQINRWRDGPDEPGIHLLPGYIVARVNGDDMLVFGPLPRFVEPGRGEQLTGLGLILFLAALAIALLLRPVVKQFQQVERVAGKIASGDLSARIDEHRSLSATNLAQAFNNMAGQTESFVRTQNELLQAVSHELRTPLARIHFAADLIRTGDEAQREERITSMESAADDLDKLVGELLSYVRMENDPAFAPIDFQVDEVVAVQIEKLQLLHPHVRFQTEISDDALTIQADPRGFERSVANLLSNAAKFCRRQVTIRAQKADKRITIDVDDDGPGIPEPDRKRVFDPFVRLGDSAKGVGLGLAIVRRILRRHDGTIEILQSPLGGCRIRTTWPATWPGQDDAQS